MNSKIGFLGGARYCRPLEPTMEKKFRAMASLGEIFIVGFSTGLRPEIFNEHATFYLLPKLPIAALRYLELFVLGQLLTHWMILRHRVQMVVAQSPYEGFVAALAIKSASWLGYKVGLAVEVHGDFEESLFLYRRVRVPSLYRFIMSGVARYAIERADVLRAISDFTTEQLKRWAPQKPIVQFSAWTDIETFLARGRERKPELPNTVLYAGVLTPLKGVHHLINAFGLISAQFANARLVIAGAEQNRDYAVDLRKKVADLNLGHRVAFAGPLSQSELAQCMAGASVLVLPSNSEGFGRVVLEAMATGTPVIGSRVGGIPELIEDGHRGFLVPPGDERGLAQKIGWVFENRDQAEAMGQAAQAFAAQRFSTARYLHGYREIFTIAEQRSEQREHATSPL